MDLPRISTISSARRSSPGCLGWSSVMNMCGLEGMSMADMSMASLAALAASGFCSDSCCMSAMSAMSAPAAPWLGGESEADGEGLLAEFCARAAESATAMAAAQTKAQGAMAAATDLANFTAVPLSRITCGDGKMFRRPAEVVNPSEGKKLRL